MATVHTRFAAVDRHRSAGTDLDPLITSPGQFACTGVALFGPDSAATDMETNA